LPARVEWLDGVPVVKALKWQGSGDVAALARSNCFLVIGAERENISAGETVFVLLRKDVI
jgi:molybdopterin molybdotransferase